MKASQRCWLVLGILVIACVLLYGVDGGNIGMRSDYEAPKYENWFKLLVRAGYVALLFGSLFIWAGAKEPLGSGESIFSKTEEKKT